MSDFTLVNTTQLGGNQSNVQTVAFANGGYVVAWTSNHLGQKEVFFQRFDSSGNAIGGPVQANAPSAANQVLSDIVVTADGNFSMVWTTEGSKIVTVKSFDGDTGVATGPQVNLTATGVIPTAIVTGAELIATSGNGFKLVISVDNGTATVLQQATLNTSGANTTLAGITTTAPLGDGLLVTEVVDGNVPGSQFILLSNGTLISSTTGTIRADAGVADIIKLQNGLHVLADSNAANEFLSGLSGAGGPLFSVPIMVILRYAPLAAVGTSQVLQIFAAASGSLGNLVVSVVPATV